jgi:hypothetical protein
MAPGGKKPQKILKLGDYEVWVAISEKRTEVYQVTEKGNTISCFIASEEGKVRPTRADFDIVAQRVSFRWSGFQCSLEK